MYGSKQVAGKYIKEYIGEKFDRYYTSEYVRAMETAALLDLPGARWYTEIVLRERDKGPLDNTSIIERNEKWAEEMERRKRDRSKFCFYVCGGCELQEMKCFFSFIDCVVFFGRLLVVRVWPMYVYVWIIHSIH
jgi:hypothetical protein